MSVKRRLDKLEQAEAITDEAAPPFISVASLDELAALELRRPTKVYIGISPHDWDEAEEQAPS